MDKRENGLMNGNAKVNNGNDGYSPFNRHYSKIGLFATPAHESANGVLEPHFLKMQSLFAQALKSSNLVAVNIF